jgi:Cof subfamily protein (haloacid dehalogenase superfamily)
MSTNPHGIKVIFFDIDGTLFSHTQMAIPQSARDALAEVRANGVKTVIATGRHKVDLQSLPTADMEFDGYLALNGMMILDKSMQLISGTAIDPDECKILSLAFRAKKIPFLILTEDGRYMNYINELAQHGIDTGEYTLPDPVDDFKRNGRPIFQLCAFVNAEQRQLLDDILEGCDITSWSETGIDIVPKGGGKVSGIKHYIEAEGIDQSETMAFGDGENDVEMLAFAGIGVAMGNGVEDAKAAADYVTTSVDEDGIANGLRHFGLID